MCIFEDGDGMAVVDAIWHMWNVCVQILGSLEAFCFLILREVCGGGCMGMEWQMLTHVKCVCACVCADPWFFGSMRRTTQAWWQGAGDQQHWCHVWHSGTGCSHYTGMLPCPALLPVSICPPPPPHTPLIFYFFLYFCTALWFHPLLSQSWLLFFLHADYFPFHCQPPLHPPPPAIANHRPHPPSLLPAIHSFCLGDLLPTAKAVADRRVCDWRSRIDHLMFSWSASCSIPFTFVHVIHPEVTLRGWWEVKLQEPTRSRLPFVFADLSR